MASARIDIVLLSALVSTRLIIGFMMMHAMACKRVVEIENPYPVNVRHCVLDHHLKGLWSSDSVWVITESDTLDSTIVNRAPGLIYLVTTLCDADTLFMLEYYNYAYVRTLEVSSTNFEGLDSAYLIYNALDPERGASKAELRLEVWPTGDSTMTVWFKKELGHGQRSFYSLYLRKYE